MPGSIWWAEGAGARTGQAHHLASSVERGCLQPLLGVFVTGLRPASSDLEAGRGSLLDKGFCRWLQTWAPGRTFMFPNPEKPGLGLQLSGGVQALPTEWTAFILGGTGKDSMEGSFLRAGDPIGT